MNPVYALTLVPLELILKVFYFIPCLLYTSTMNRSLPFQMVYLNPRLFWCIPMTVYFFGKAFLAVCQTPQMDDNPFVICFYVGFRNINWIFSLVTVSQLQDKLDTKAFPPPPPPPPPLPPPLHIAPAQRVFSFRECCVETWPNVFIKRNCLLCTLK